MFTRREIQRLILVGTLVASAITLQGCGKDAPGVGIPSEKKWSQLMQSGEQAFGTGNIQGAEKFFQEALAEAERFGKNDTRVSDTLNDLAMIYAAHKDYQKAIETSKRSLAIQEEIYGRGKDNKDIAYIMNNLGTYLDLAGMHEEARQTLENALAMRERVLGQTHLLVAVTTNNLAENAIAMKKFDLAEQYIRKTLGICKANKSSTEVFQTTDRLARFLTERGQYQKAEQLYMNAMDDEQKSQQPNSTFMFLYATAIGEVYYQSKDYAKSEQWYSDLIKSAPPKSLGTAQWMNAMADSMIKQGKYKQAEPVLKSALTIVEASAAKDQAPAIMLTYADVLEKLGKTKQAAAMRAKAGGK